jgi:adenylyltransferase/sulfurtransferase
MPDFGVEGQVKLKESSVAVVGAGGLGTPAAVYLVSAGVGKVGLIDDDVVERVNLHRQFLYSEGDVGKLKVDVLTERLAAVNPYAFVAPHATKLSVLNALKILSFYDVVVDATDNSEARYLVNDACTMLGKPDVFASVLGFEGQASVFWNGKGPCYRCLFPNPPPPDALTIGSCQEAGVLGALPGIMGGIQAAEAIGLIIGKGSPLVGRLLNLDALNMRFTEMKVEKDLQCRMPAERFA